MFLKLFEPIFAALKKDLKIGLIAILIVLAVALGVNGENRVKEARDECAEERRDLRAENNALRVQIRETHQRMENYVFAQLEKNVQQNDSTIREKTTSDINKVMP